MTCCPTHNVYPGPNRSDPSRTTTLRRSLMAELRRRFALLRSELFDLLVRGDAAGLSVNVFCPTGKGGGIDPTCKPGGKGTAVPFNQEPHKLPEYKDAPDPGEASAADFLRVTKELKAQGRLIEEKGRKFVELYHITSPDYVESIKAHGLVPAGASATGQNFKAKHAPYAVYFHSSKQAAKLNLEQTEGTGRLITARIHITRENLRRFIPDEDASNNPNDGLKELIDGGPVAFIGGVPKNAVKVEKGGPTANAQEWVHLRSDEKLDAFRDWLRATAERVLLGADDETLWRSYIQAAFEKGAGRAYDDASRRGFVGKVRDFYLGSKAQFLHSAFGRPVAVEKLKLLVSRSLSDLEGVTTAMSAVLTRTLADGLARGLSPRDVGRELDKAIGIGRRRAEMIARTEIVRAHADGQLLALEQLGVRELKVMVEWVTAGDSRVCPACQPLGGVVIPIDKASGLIPRHPNCRCAWVPANVGESSEEQKRTKRRIQSAVRASVKVAKDDFKIK